MNTSLKSVRLRPDGRSSGPLEITEPLLCQLDDDLGNRRIAVGIARVEDHLDNFRHLSPDHPHAGRVASCLAQWVDVGFAGPQLVRESLSRFAPAARAQLPVREYIHLEMAEGFLAMSEEEPDEGIRHLDVVLAMGAQFHENVLLPVANFWKGRCLRRKGDYDEALTYTLRGDTLANELGYPKMAAVMRVLQSWLLFQK